MTVVPLHDVLADAQARGFIGRGAIDDHVRHAHAFLPLVGEAQTAVDLGPGGGLPGLVLAASRPDVAWILVEGAESRATFLEEAVLRLGWHDRVTVDGRRAELVGRDPARRHQADLVVARAFGPPAVVAEMAAPLLVPGGRLVVSEPPGAPDSRWPADGVARLGLAVRRELVGPPAFVELEATERCPERYPRRVGVPAKRPVF